MRRAICASSASSSCDPGSACLLSSSARRRSTARPRRMFNVARMVPTAVSMNTGATASWMTPVIPGMCGSTALFPRCLFFQPFRAPYKIILEFRLSIEQGVGGDRFLPRQARGDALAAFSGIGPARLRLARDGDGSVDVVAGGLAEFHRVGEAVEG